MSHTTIVLGVAVIVAAVIVLRFEVLVLTDIARSTSTRILPPLAWALLAIVTIPLGGVAYWVYGRDAGPRLGA